MIEITLNKCIKLFLHNFFIDFSTYHNTFTNSSKVLIKSNKYKPEVMSSVNLFYFNTSLTLTQYKCFVHRTRTLLIFFFFAFIFLSDSTKKRKKEKVLSYIRDIHKASFNCQ